jgi:hypothetical protein
MEVKNHFINLKMWPDFNFRNITGTYNSTQLSQVPNVENKEVHHTLPISR